MLRRKTMSMSKLRGARRAMSNVPPKGVTAQVQCGDGAVMDIVNPHHDYSIEWQLRYGDAVTVRYCAASLLASYDYLLSGEINTTEAVRRLRLMRAKRRELLDAALAPATRGTAA